MSIRPEEIVIPLEFREKGHEALVNVWWTGTLLKRMARQFFRQAGISEVEFNLLMALKYAKKDLTQVDLSRRLLVDRSNITGVVDRLEQNGLLVRNPVKEDRRRYHITLTEAGRAKVDGADPMYHALIKQIMSGLSPAEHQMLVDLTLKLRRGLLEHVKEEVV